MGRPFSASLWYRLALSQTGSMFCYSSAQSGQECPTDTACNVVAEESYGGSLQRAGRGWSQERWRVGGMGVSCKNSLGQMWGDFRSKEPIDNSHRIHYPSANQLVNNQSVQLQERNVIGQSMSPWQHNTRLDNQFWYPPSISFISRMSK